MADSIGYLSVRQHSEHGFFGGFLVVNPHARPLEFHCTLPVKPTKAQELLYGPTLFDFVCGEQIAKSLVTKAKLKPFLILTDTPAALALENVVSTKIGLLAGTQDADLSSGSRRASETPAGSLLIPNTNSSVRDATLLDERIYMLSSSRWKPAELESKVKGLDGNFDLGEPFQRIVEALLEAHPVVKASRAA